MGWRTIVRQPFYISARDAPKKDLQMIEEWAEYDFS